LSILHIALFQNNGDEGLLAGTDSGFAFLTVDFDDKELCCQEEVIDLRSFQELGININCGFGCVIWEGHQGIVNV